MFIAEGPGEHEDAEGVPFRGESGILLDQLLEEAGIDREEVYITNSVLCRPTRPSAAGHGLVNRPPTKLEVENCLPRLRREILAINPKIVVSLGDVAASALVGKKLGIKTGESTPDGRILLKKEEECLAACGGGPMMQVDHVYYENLTPERVDEILDKLD